MKSHPSVSLVCTAPLIRLRALFWPDAVCLLMFAPIAPQARGEPPGSQEAKEWPCPPAMPPLPHRR